MTDRHIAGEMKIKETNKNNRKPDSAENVTTVEEGAIWPLIVGQRIKKNNMTSTTSLREPHFVEKSRKMTMKKTSKNGWETAVSHHT